MFARRLNLTAALLIGLSAIGALISASAMALPPERHYEMVSPPYKAGYGVTGMAAVSPDGERVAFSSLGAFAGAPSDHISPLGEPPTYMAVRNSGGWSTVPVLLPASIFPGSIPALDYSPDLETALFSVLPGRNSEWGQYEGKEIDVVVHPTLGAADAFEVIGEPLGVPSGHNPGEQWGYDGGSADFSHVIAETIPNGYRVTPEAVGIANSTEVIFDLRRSAEGAQALHLVGVNNRAEPRPIAPSCQVTLGSGGSGSTFNAIAKQGQEIFFTAQCEPHRQLFVRLNDERTLEVSRPLEAGPSGGCGDGGKPGEAPGEVPCQGALERPAAEFIGASQDGTRVLFATSAQLSPSDTDTTNDLYMASIGCPVGNEGCVVSEREVTGVQRISNAASAGEAAEVQGVVAVSKDLSHVYFVARGRLSGPNTAGEAPMGGADNLYLYDAARQTTTFVVDLCSDAGRSGSALDAHCPSSLDSYRNDSQLWERGVGGFAQVAGDGRFLLLPSYGQLTSDDTDSTRDMFRYDASTGVLVRVSAGEAGYDANGNNDSFDASVAPNERFPSTLIAGNAISEDGSRVVFQSAEPLSPAATNGLVNSYEWHEGAVSLVSTGNDPTPVSNAGITPAGRDIFFTTTLPLVSSQDTDEELDVYDARTGPGFPATPGLPQPCSGDACQGPLTNPAPLLVPGSVSQAPGENVVMQAAVTKRKKTAKRKRTGRRHRPRPAHANRTRNRRKR